jgi:hypothetical protein
MLLKCPGCKTTNGSRITYIKSPTHTLHTPCDKGQEKIEHFFKYFKTIFLSDHVDFIQYEQLIGVRVFGTLYRGVYGPEDHDVISKMSFVILAPFFQTLKRH